MLAASSSVWVQTIVSVVIVSLISFVGIVILVVRQGLLHKVVPILVSFAVGALLGDALFHILPELAVDGGITVGISWVMAGAILGFFVLEKFIHMHHRLEAPAHGHIHPVALTNLLGDGLHNFVDGAIIAGSSWRALRSASPQRRRSSCTRSHRRWATSASWSMRGSLRDEPSSSTS